MGVSVYKQCNTWWCPIRNRIFGYLVEFALGQDWIAPADYFRSWYRLDRFYDNNLFLTDINNEGETKNPLYSQRLSSVKNFGLFLWIDDNTVVPKESEWFAYWDEQDGNHEMVYLRKQQIYKEDWIGLKTLDESNRLFFYFGPGEHMTLTLEMIHNKLAPLLLNQTP